MNNISAIEKLVATTVKVKVPRNPTQHQVGVELEIRKIPLDKIGLLNFSSNDVELSHGEQLNKMKPLILECLDISEELLDKISVDYLMEIIEVIMEIHTPNIDKKGKEDMIAQMKAARKEIK